MVADPYAASDDAAPVGRDPVNRAILGLARLLAEAPWTLQRDDLVRAREAGLGDDAVLHVILLAAIFGYLNRVADAVGIELDYDVVVQPPRADASWPALARPEPDAWPDPDAPRPLDLAQRPDAAAALATWRAYLMEREAPLTSAQRSLVARVVAERLGDAATARAMGDAVPQSALDHALERFADCMTLAPWRLGASALEPLRAAGLTDDAALLDAIATTACATATSRVAVALAALAR